MFSFKGRLSRMPFLIGLIVLVAFVVALQGSIMFTLNLAFVIWAVAALCSARGFAMKQRDRTKKNEAA
jgi:uncharacterized membrane protein YhaH (DUF805 family)